MSNVESVAFEFYGVLRRLAGSSTWRMTIAAGSTVADALALLARHQPALAPELPRCACAVGDAIVPRTRVLSAGEHMALLPPVSGG